jgi:hypothetical protein
MGTVTDGKDVIAGAVVRLRPQKDKPFGGEWPQRTASDQHGGFVIRNISPGDYEVAAEIGSEDSPKGTSTHRQKAIQTVTLHENETKALTLQIKDEQ